MKVLLDQGMNPRLYDYLAPHETIHASHIGWSRSADKDMVPAAEELGFDVLVTTDKKLYAEQKVASRRIGVVVLSGTRTKLIQAAHERIRAAVEATTPGSYRYVDLQANS